MTDVLEGGYKAYRHLVLESISEKRKTILLGGMTGSSKTQILRYLKSSGEHVIDLEGLANHKGSAFGAIGQPSQPSTEHFVNLLFDEWRRTDKTKPLWLEDESRNIGTVFMYDKFYLNMQDSPIVVLMMDARLRMPRLIEEYSLLDADELKASVNRISKRLGGDKAKEAINAIDAGDIAKAIEIVLQYYDKTYLYSLERKDKRNITIVETDTDNIETNAHKILEAAAKINW